MSIPPLNEPPSLVDEPELLASAKKKTKKADSIESAFFTEDTLKAYMARPGFLQKSEKVPKLLNEELYRVCKQMVKEAILDASHAGAKSLRRQQAIRGIEATHVVPKGSY